MSGVFGPVDYGPPIQGARGLSATATSVATAAVLQRKVSHFSTVNAGAIVLLPHVTNVELDVLNRGANALTVTSLNDQIEGYGSSVQVAPGGNARFSMFDPPAAPPPWVWVLS